MHPIRVIPRLDIKGPNLVKGIHLEGLRVLGKPEDFSQFYYEQGADELIYMDVVASLYGRNNLHEVIEKTAKNIFIPLTVGGGIRSLEDIRAILRAGADKVSINTQAIQTPDFIREAAQKYGSSTIVVSIEALRNPNGTYEAFTDNGRESTGVDPFEWAVRAEALGAGEIMITSINQEGTGKGYDLELTKKIQESVQIPVIACGGAGNSAHVVDVVREAHIDAVAVASMMHYHALQSMDGASNSSEEGNTEFLRSKRNFSRVEAQSIGDLKQAMAKNNIACRECTIAAEVNV